MHLGPEADLHADLDRAYHRKYDRYGAQIVATVVGPDAAAVTLRLDPEPSSHSD